MLSQKTTLKGYTIYHTGDVEGYKSFHEGSQFVYGLTRRLLAYNFLSVEQRALIYYAALNYFVARDQDEEKAHADFVNLLNFAALDPLTIANLDAIVRYPSMLPQHSGLDHTRGDFAKDKQRQEKYITSALAHTVGLSNILKELLEKDGFGDSAQYYWGSRDGGLTVMWGLVETSQGFNKPSTVPANTVKNTYAPFESDNSEEKYEVGSLDPVFLEQAKRAGFIIIADDHVFKGRILSKYLTYLHEAGFSGKIYVVSYYLGTQAFENFLGDTLKATPMDVTFVTGILYETLRPEFLDKGTDIGDCIRVAFNNTSLQPELKANAVIEGAKAKVSRMFPLA